MNRENRKQILRTGLPLLCIGACILCVLIGYKTSGTNDNGQLIQIDNVSLYGYEGNMSYQGYGQVLSCDELLDGTELVISRSKTESSTSRYIMSSNFATNGSKQYFSRELVSCTDNYINISTSQAMKITLKYDSILSESYLYADESNNVLLTGSKTSNILFKTAYDVQFSWDISINNTGNTFLSCNYSKNTNNPYLSYIDTLGGFSAVSSTSSGVYLYTDTVQVVNLWAEQYLYLSTYNSSMGYCSTYYPVAKAKLFSMGERFVSALYSDEHLYDAKQRYEAWAKANLDSYPYKINN